MNKLSKLVKWELLHPRMKQENLGNLRFFLHKDDPRSASEQINERYRYGGWEPFSGFESLGDGELIYPGDPVVRPLARAYLRTEVIYFYKYDWVAVFQPDGSFEVSRVD